MENYTHIMSSKTRVMLLSCGSFNPITDMHLRMFELARDYLHNLGIYQVIGGIISPVNDAYNKKDLATAKHRCKMVDLALQTSNWVKLDCWESDQDCWIPTVSVLDHHQTILNSVTNTNNAVNSAKRQKLEDLNNMNNNEQKTDWDLSQPVHIMLLCGADLLESFGVPNLWKDSDIAQIVGKYGLVVITRNGSNPERFIYDSDILSKLRGSIHIVTEWITNEVSSTHIRRALKRGNSVKYLIQDSVLNYIKDHDLYSSSKL